LSAVRSESGLPPRRRKAQYCGSMEQANGPPSARRALILMVMLARPLVAMSIVQASAPGNRQPRRKPGRRASDVDVAELMERLEQAMKRAKEAQKVARSFATRLRKVSTELEGVERESSDERDMAVAAEQQIDLLDEKLQEIGAAAVEAAAAPVFTELQRQLAEVRRRADEMEERAIDAESRLSVMAPLQDPVVVLQGLEERVVTVETLATEAEERVRSFEELAAEGGSGFRQRLALTAARKRGASVPPAAPETKPEMDLRTAISRGMRGPLTRASGLALSLQGTIESVEAKATLRQLSSSLRRLNQLAADLKDAHRIIDGSLPLDRRRTDMAALMSATLEDAAHLEDRLVRLDAVRVHARVDPVRARQIVEGMLDAAGDRTRSSASIVVRVHDTDAGVRVTVEDDNRSPTTIGPELSLAVRLAGLHGTEITVEGSAFRVVFPRDARP
jgi:signal transduction histidine kinase